MNDPMTQAVGGAFWQGRRREKGLGSNDGDARTVVFHGEMDIPREGHEGDANVAGRAGLAWPGAFDGLRRVTYQIDEDAFQIFFGDVCVRKAAGCFEEHSSVRRCYGTEQRFQLKEHGGRVNRCVLRLRRCCYILRGFRLAAVDEMTKQSGAALRDATQLFGIVMVLRAEHSGA
jgi:hypothetical protein